MADTDAAKAEKIAAAKKRVSGVIACTIQLPKFTEWKFIA